MHCSNCPTDHSKEKNIYGAYEFDSKDIYEVESEPFANTDNTNNPHLGKLFVPIIKKRYENGHDSVDLVYPLHKLVQTINGLQSHQTYQDALKYCKKMVRIFLNNINVFRMYKNINGENQFIKTICTSNGKSSIQLFNSNLLSCYQNHAISNNLLNTKINADSSGLYKI